MSDNYIKFRYISVLVIIVILSITVQSCVMQKRAIKTTHLPQLAESGSEKWSIDGKQYDIESTYIVVFEDSTVQYTINYLCYEDIDFDNMTPEKARYIAFPIANYAYEKELYKSKEVSKVGSGKLSVSYIGVAIIDKINSGKKGTGIISTTQGYRTNFSFDEINKMKENTSPFIN